jgi:ribosome-associated toxin RatA of RatAB toxin-antitoxin module
MKELHGTASAAVGVPGDRCFALLADVEGYPRWYPDVVRDVQVLERDGPGQPTKVRTTLHVAQGRLARDFTLTMAVTAQRPSLVKLTRVPNEPSDEERFEVAWHLDSSAETRIRLELDANLSVPRLLPLGGIGDSIAHGFVAAAARALA